MCTKTQDPDPSVYSGYDWSTNTDVDMGNCDITATVSTGNLIMSKEPDTCCNHGKYCHRTSCHTHFESCDKFFSQNKKISVKN